MTDQPLPDDISADHLDHMDRDIQLYTDQLATLDTLVIRAQQQLDAATARRNYVAGQLKVAQQAKADFVKSAETKEK